MGTECQAFVQVRCVMPWSSNHSQSCPTEQTDVWLSALEIERVPEYLSVALPGCAGELSGSSRHAWPDNRALMVWLTDAGVQSGAAGVAHGTSERNPMIHRFLRTSLLHRHMEER